MSARRMQIHDAHQAECPYCLYREKLVVDKETLLRVNEEARRLLETRERALREALEWLESHPDPRAKMAYRAALAPRRG